MNHENTRRNPFLGLTAVLALVCTVVVLSPLASRGDTIVIGTKTHTGTFEVYEKGRFIFRTAEGKLLKQNRTSVRRLTLDTLKAVRLVRSGKKQSEEATLVGYDKTKFTIKQAGRKQTLFGARVERILVMQAPKPLRVVAKRPRIAVEVLEDMESLSPEQAAALDRYKAARRRHDDFLEESSRLVSEMDGTTGKKREQLLDILRRRKNDEQPILRELEQAEAALLAVFPKPAAPQPPVPPGMK